MILEYGYVIITALVFVTSLFGSIYAWHSDKWNSDYDSEEKIIMFGAAGTVGCIFWPLYVLGALVYFPTRALADKGNDKRKARR